MNTTSCFFTADYRDGQVYYAGKKYPAGHFTVQLMNQYYKNDTAARIAVFSGFGFRILGQLRDGFLNVRELHKVGENLHWAVKALPRLSPFDQIDQDVMQAEVSDLFTEESGQEVCEYFRYRGTIANVEEDEVIVGTVDRMINRDYMQRMEKRINRIKELLQFFDRLSDDLYRTHRFLSDLVDRLDEAERLDEAHLLPLALEIFGTPEMPFSTQYVSTPKNSRSKGGSVTRRLSFDRFASFIVTDFFEGLHHGHYLRQCPICGQYFLMQSARRQIYCSTGYAPAKYRGKRLPCRKYAVGFLLPEEAQGKIPGGSEVAVLPVDVALKTPVDTISHINDVLVQRQQIVAAAQAKIQQDRLKAGTNRARGNRSVAGFIFDVITVESVGTV